MKWIMNSGKISVDEIKIPNVILAAKLIQNSYHPNR